MKTFTKRLLLLFLCTALPQLLHAQNKPPVKLGAVSEVRASFEMKGRVLKTKTSKVQISQKIPGQPPLVINLKHSKKDGKSTSYFGEVNNQKNSNFYLRIEDNNVSGFIMLRDKKKYYDYTINAGGTVELSEKDIDKTLCVDYRKSPVPITSTAQRGMAVASVPVLESLPGAEAVVLLDFDGETLTNTFWNGFSNGEAIIASPANLSTFEMEETWRLMSEDFRPFALNVTTSEAVFNSAPANRRTRIIFTPTNYFYPDAGGAAYIGSFTWGGTSYQETPAFVWNSGAKYAGEAGSHEAGHTLHLVHDGRITPYNEEYFYGQDSWSPIMGAGYYTSEVQWSKGEYPNASNFEDDLQLITTSNGFGYRTDDHGNTRGTATALLMDAEGTVSPSANKGIITTQTDQDVFSFTTSGGMVTLDVYSDAPHPNLNIKQTLRDSSGKEIAANTSSISQTLGAGTYYLEIDGIQGSLGADSDYGSLGEYFISGYIPVNASPVVSLTSPTAGQRFTAPATIRIAANASDADGTVAKVEFFHGNTKLGEDLTAPYTYTWKVAVAGSYALMAKATDNKGATTNSKAVTITVTERKNQSPVVRITSPTNGQKITIPQNPIKIVAVASDADGTVAKVEFFNGSTRLGEDLTAPYTLSWRQPHIGKYPIRAIATDNTGNKTTSAVVVVEVVKPGKGNMAKVPGKSSPKPFVGEELAELNVYPNPITADKILKVDLPTAYSEVKIILYELGTGRKVAEQNYTHTQALQVDVSALPQGLYGLTILAEGNVWTKKLLVTR